MAKSVKKANELGFCPGVKKAIETTMKEARKTPVFTLGRLVHNDVVVKELESLGIEVISVPLPKSTMSFSIRD
jgi:4-hydroxy-3-methylbut-2-enyl diphosphate reductase